MFHRFRAGLESARGPFRTRWARRILSRRALASRRCRLRIPANLNEKRSGKALPVLNAWVRDDTGETDRGPIVRPISKSDRHPLFPALVPVGKARHCHAHREASRIRAWVA